MMLLMLPSQSLLKKNPRLLQLHLLLLLLPKLK